MQIQINTCERTMTFAHVMESVLTQKKLLQEDVLLQTLNL